MAKDRKGSISRNERVVPVQGILCGRLRETLRTSTERAVPHHKDRTKGDRCIIFRTNALCELGAYIEAFPVELSVSRLTPSLWLRDQVSRNIQPFQPVVQRLGDAIPNHDHLSRTGIKLLNQRSRIHIPRLCDYPAFEIRVPFIDTHDARVD